MRENTLVVIPARGGSVRVPRKNIRLLNGKPLLAYAIEAAKRSRTVDRVVISTDDPEIADVALQFGAEVPFYRPASISGDVPTEEVVIHAIDWLNQHERYYPHLVVCLEPPKPFRRSEHVDKCVERMMADESVDSAITVHNARGNRPEWMVRIETGLVHPYTDYFRKQGEALLRFPASQEFEKLYQVNGIVFACRVETLRRFGTLVGVKCAAVEVDNRDVMDLDYPEDFEICELLMRSRLGSGE